ncbi:MAG: efflux RND transporter permease subunit [Thermoguttaceae bacterium]
MESVIRASLKNPRMVTVAMLTIVLLGFLTFKAIPIDILPVYKSPAVQVLTFYGGMPASGVEKDITNRMERWTGQAAGTSRQESRSIVGASVVRNYYRQDVDPNGALTQVNSLASAAIPNLPPGTLPPVILPFDPTSLTPVCIVALDSATETESILYDVGRYEVRNMIMAIPGAVAPVVYGGKIRAIMAYLDRTKMQARGLSPVDVMTALDSYNLFLPTGDAKFGGTDYAIDSNSMYELVKRMGDIPLRTEHGNVTFLKDVAKPEDASFIQTNVVRVNGRRQVYIPVYRQSGSSTLAVVSALKKALPDIKSRLSRTDIDLKVVMDQSVYVRHSIESLAEEGVLGAILCSLVILVFLGEWRMTIIAVLTVPIAVMGAVVCLYYSGQTINVMTLAGLSLAIGPLVDTAIISLENTHRHLGLGATVAEAAFVGSNEVALPELAASLCTLLVLAPLAVMPSSGQFLYLPMALGVTFAMVVAFLQSRSFVPTRCAAWLRPHLVSQGLHQGVDHGNRNEDEFSPPRSWIGHLRDRWESVINRGIDSYERGLAFVLRRRLLTISVAVGLLVATILLLGTRLRREFFPEVDAGAFEIYMRAPSGTRIEVTEAHAARAEEFIRQRLGDDLELIVSELGVTADWSAAYTPNAGPMDAVIKVQLKDDRKHSAQEYVRRLRAGFAADHRFGGLEFSFDASGMIGGAMNEGKSTPLNVRITAHDLATARKVAENIQREVSKVEGIVDSRILQRLDYPEYVIDVDRTKAADLGLNQDDVMKNVVAALNSSIQFNKRNFWIDPVSQNQYYVGVQYPEADIKSINTLLDIPITSPVQKQPIPLKNIVSLRQATVPAEVTHLNLQATIDLTMGVEGRDLGHVADDVTAVIAKFGQPEEADTWLTFDPSSPNHKLLEGSKIHLSGEYSRMQETFRNLGLGLILATLLIYFLLVTLFKSYITPLVILSAVPIGLVGVIVMLFTTGTAINVQSLLGVIFMVGIVVSNTVLLVDFSENIRREGQLDATEAIRRAASIRVRPIVMTALAAFFALLPMALALARGSEANAPLGRAVIGGLLAGLVTTLFVVPALYSLIVRKQSLENDAATPTSAESKA